MCKKNKTTNDMKNKNTCRACEKLMCENKWFDKCE